MIVPLCTPPQSSENLTQSGAVSQSTIDSICCGAAKISAGAHLKCCSVRLGDDVWRGVHLTPHLNGPELELVCTSVIHGAIQSVNDSQSFVLLWAFQPLRRILLRLA